jgi:hypothetical protein
MQKEHLEQQLMKPKQDNGQIEQNITKSAKSKLQFKK